MFGLCFIFDGRKSLRFRPSKYKTEVDDMMK
jgi:hypothetical protein